MRRSISLLSFAIPLVSALLLGCADELPAPPAPSDPLGPLGDALPVDERLEIQNLSGPVDVVRDTFGRPHIYATSVADALRVEGYLVARDRALQLDFFRRVSEGRLAEILYDSDKSLLDLDISFRHIGLHRVAKVQYDELPPGEVKDGIDAFADGVTQAFRKIRDREIQLPAGLLGISPDGFTDWTGPDSLAVGRLQTHLLSFDADFDLSNQLFFDQARAAFSASDPDPLLQKRAGFLMDYIRFAPADSATTRQGWPSTMGGPEGGPPKPPQSSKHYIDASTKVSPKPPSPKPPPAKPLTAKRHIQAPTKVVTQKPPTPKPAPKPILPYQEALAKAKGYLAAMERSRALLRPEGFGSNNWAVSPAKSATGNALVASDPHLSLSAPSVFWPVSLHITPSDKEPMHASGMAFPGIPGIILGHTEHVAWGATVAGYDVSDAYAETLNADATGVIFEGQEVPFEAIDEVIELQSGGPYTYQVLVVPHHGPILPNIDKHEVIPPMPGESAISIRWTGAEPTAEILAVFDLLRAKDVDEARAALKNFGVGAQNWMLADTSGHILWTSHAKVPIRDKAAFTWDASTYQGTLPCLVLPGDGTAEWKGYVHDDVVAWDKDPEIGYLSTANNDPIGDTLDNDPSNDFLPDGTPMYAACQFDIGFREGRIQKRLEERDDHTTETLASIQGDVRSAMGSALTPLLLDALDRAEAEKASPGAHPDLAAIVADPRYDSALIVKLRAILDAWGTEADYEAASGVNPDDNTALPLDSAEAKASQATVIYNAWAARLMYLVFGDEFAVMGATLSGRETIAKALLHLVNEDPQKLATFDPATGDSAIWDDLTTPEVESRHERMVRALLDALTSLAEVTGSADVDTYRWGHLHTIRFTALISAFGSLSIPPTSDMVFTKGFPRHGDNFSVDSSDFPYPSKPTIPLKHSYTNGPVQRFVIDMDPSGPKAFNALPGGAVWDASNKHFADEAEFWRRNQNHPVPFQTADVVAAYESRQVFTAPKTTQE